MFYQKKFSKGFVRENRDGTINIPREEKLIRELEEKREEIEKEQQHYLNEMNRLKEQIEVETNSQRLIYLKEKESEILKVLVDVDTALKDLDYRQANYRAGYVSLSLI